MTDTFEFTLSSPLTKEDWAILADYEYESSNSVTFQTPTGKQVKFIKADILDKIREEIEEKAERYCLSRESIYMGQVEWSERLIKESDVLKIIDKYRQEG